MGSVIGEILPLAVAVAIAPVPIIAVILLLLTDHPKANAGAFAVGFYVGVAAVLGIFMLIASSQDLSSPDSTASTGSDWMKIVLGLLVVFASFRQFRKRPAPGQIPEQPKWLAGISSFTAAKSLLTGLIVGAVNPKPIVMSLAAASIISAASLSTGEDIAVVLIYALIGSVCVIAPLVVAIALGSRSATILDGWKAWLGENNAVVMSVLFLVIGVVLIGKGITGLA